MYRDGKRVLTAKRHNFVLNHGALGDAICSLPAIIKAGRSFSDVLDLRVWCGSWQHELFAHLLAPHGKFTMEDLSKFPYKAAERKQLQISADFGGVSYNAAIFDTHTRNRVHMVDYAFAFLIEARPESMHERSYPTAAETGPKVHAWQEKPYVVFPVGATSENKLFRASVMAPIMQWCLEHGYQVVITGTETSHTHVNEGGALKPIKIIAQTSLLPPELFAQIIDMREKTTLLQLRDILGNAAAVVGVDGGTIHLAATTTVPIVYAMGTTLPKHRFIARFGDPNYKIRYVGPRDLECAGCQSNWLMTTWDFRHCVYQDNACMGLLSPADFTTALQQLGL